MTLFDYSHILTDIVDKLSDNCRTTTLTADFSTNIRTESLYLREKPWKKSSTCQGQYCFRDISESRISTART